jgi:hypothetical protein
MLVRDGDIVIERSPSGQLNLMGLAESIPGTAHMAARLAHQASPAATTPPAVSSPAGLLVSDIALDGVTITFVDQMVAPGQVVTTTVSEVRGHLRGLSVKTAMPFDLAATVLADGTRRIRVRGTVGPIAENLDIAGAPINATLQAADLPIAPLTPYLGQRFPLSRGRLGADVSVQGSWRGSVRIHGALSLADAALRGRRGGEAATALPVLMSIQDLRLDLASASVTLAEARVDLRSLQATLTGAVSNVRTAPAFDLQLATNAFAPGELLRHVPLLASAVPTPVDLHGRVQLQATLIGTFGKLRSEAQLDISHLSLKSGSFNGDAQGGGGISLETDTAHMTLTTHLKEPQSPYIHMDLRAHRLVLDHRGTTAAVPALTPPSGPTTNAPPAHTRLSQVTLDGTVRIAEGKSQHLSFQQLRADLALVQGRLMSTQQATLYGGSYQGMVQMNLAQAEPTYAWDARITDMHLGEAITAFTPANHLVDGVLAAHLKLAGRGWTWAGIERTLRGDGTATLTDARFMPPEGTPSLSREVTVRSPLGSMTTHIRLRRHAFNAVDTTFQIGQGQVWSDHLQVSGRDIEILAKGYWGFWDQSIAYNGHLVLSGERASEHGVLANFLRDTHGRLVVPFRLDGTVRDPAIVVEVQDLLRGRKTR